ATRAQADRILYKAAIRRRLENQPNLTLFQQAVDDLMLEGDRVVGAVTQVGIRFRARAVGLKAGTPPRLDGRTIDFSRCEEQPGDLDPVPVFSFMGRRDMHPRQVPCWI